MVARLAEEVTALDTEIGDRRDDRGAISPPPPRRNHPEYANLSSICIGAASQNDGKLLRAGRARSATRANLPNW